MDKERIKTKRRLTSAMLRAADLPPEVCGALPCMTLVGERSLRVEQHRGILQITDECVRLYSEIGVIRICGKSLRVCGMDNERIAISGVILSVGFE